MSIFELQNIQQQITTKYHLDLTMPVKTPLWQSLETASVLTTVDPNNPIANDTRIASNIYTHSHVFSLLS